MDSNEIYSEIIKNNLKREKILSKYACKSIMGVRRHPEREEIEDRINIRPAFFHDTDRIIHSLAIQDILTKRRHFSFSKTTILPTGFCMFNLFQR